MTTEINIPRAAIHVGDDKKTYSAAKGAEAERRGWDEQRYHLKNLEKEKNNHYDFSRKKLNFEITKGGKIVSPGANPVPIHERLMKRHDELGFKPYMDKNHPNVVSDNSPNSLVEMIFSGDHETLYKLAFGNQKVDVENLDADNSHAYLEKGIIDWALDTYNFCCRKWGEDNIIGFDVHCDETSIHIHVLTVPVEQVKKRGRATFAFIKNDDPSVSISNKVWKKLPPEEQALYTHTEKEKDCVERVSYAKVWGESRKEKKAYLKQLHTDYHDQVGYKYGLARGIDEDELTEEERRARKHMNKVQLEAERQAKLAVAQSLEEKERLEQVNEGIKNENATLALEKEQVWHEKEEAEKALDDIKEYAALAIVDRKELRFPLLNLKKPLEEAKKGVEKEFSEPIPALLGQKKWREDRITNINDIIDGLADAVKQEQETKNDLQRKENERMYTYYMQNLKVLIEQNKGLKNENDKQQAENTKVKAENEKVKLRISQLDENAIERMRKQKDSVIGQLNERITSISSENKQLSDELKNQRKEYNGLVERFNTVLSEPEMKEAWTRVKARKERDEREAAVREREARLQEQLKRERHHNILNKFVCEAQSSIQAFALTQRHQFNESECKFMYFGIIAQCIKEGLSPSDATQREKATKHLTDGIQWGDVWQETARSAVSNWVRMYAAKADFNDSVTDYVLSFVDHMSCSQESYESLMGSNGCADQLTNWDGSQKQGLSATQTPIRKQGWPKR